MVLIKLIICMLIKIIIFNLIAHCNHMIIIFCNMIEHQYEAILRIVSKRIQLSEEEKIALFQLKL